MKNIFLISLVALLGISGCAKCNRSIFSSEYMECQRVERFWREIEADKVKMIAFFGEDSNEPVEECPFEEFKEALYQITGCCFSKPHPLAGEWVEYNRLECIRQYLENESVRRIAFYTNVMEADTERPEDWQSWAEITEPKRIKEVLKLLYKAMDNEKDRFANEDAVASDLALIQIITEEHKFLIPFSTLGISRGRPIRGVGWTSHELKEKLKQWGFSR